MFKVPPGRELVVIARGELITRVRLAVAVSFGLVESVTVTATVKVPVAVGVPVIWPLGLMESPVGKPVAVKVYGVVPPEAITVAL